MATMKQISGPQASSFFAGFGRVPRLLESYPVEDRDRFEHTQALVESGRLSQALDEHDALAEDMVTGDLPIILAGNADQHFRDAVVAVGHPWRDVWATESYRNFREQTVSDLNDTVSTDDEEANAAENNLLPEVPEHHGFNEMRVAEHYETMQLKTYGGVFSLTRQMLMDDDMRALRGIPASMGRTAARTLSSAAQLVLEVNAALSDGVALFHATHGNLSAGGTALALAGLETEFAAFMAQTMPSGRVHNIPPASLIVPPALAITADRLVNQIATTLITLDSAAAANVLTTDMNAMAGRLNVVVFPELTDANDWFLAANPDQIGTIEVGFLNGVETPELFTQVANADLSAADGQRYKVREDFDVYAVNYAGIRKVVGA